MRCRNTLNVKSQTMAEFFALTDMGMVVHVSRLTCHVSRFTFHDDLLGDLEAHR